MACGIARELGGRRSRDKSFWQLLARSTCGLGAYGNSHLPILRPRALKGLADIDPELKIPEVAVADLMRAMDLGGIQEADDGT